MKKRLTRRDFLRVGGATLAGASFTSLAACGGGGASGEPHLRITWYGDPETNRAFEAAITAFKQEHPKVSFDSTASPWEGYWDKLATQAAGGNAPDVLVQDALYIAEYAGRGALLDLSPYVGDTINLAGTWRPPSSFTSPAHGEGGPIRPDRGCAKGISNGKCSGRLLPLCRGKRASSLAPKSKRSRR